MNTTNLPVSEIIKNKDVDEPKKKSREDWRKAKELEEARKAGTAPAAVDEEGKDINPHIPQYIASAPWYFGSKGPTLKHQRPQPEKQKKFNDIAEYYVRGEKLGVASRYRKNACENCGAMTHKKKDCVERPRKVGAKFTSEDIAPDEVHLPNLSLDYDGKRDRWNGFDPSCYQAIVDEYAKVEEAKREQKEERLKQDLLSGEITVIREQNNDVDSDLDDDEEKYADNADMPGTKVDSKQRITVRNLRIREDIAKYLRNLDPNSAYYDPKTRSMRDNPHKGTKKDPEELQYAGDNFVRFTGDTLQQAKEQLFAWQGYEKGIDIHLQAEPTKTALLNKEYELKKEELKDKQKGTILDKYGGAQHLCAPPKELVFAQSEEYVEYSRRGQE
ncbi:pre-mRNA-splicing factor SLU7-like [Tachypleus tridentatus]|uniref:pre-mRNA-splicing factor SLU7-like n=1 Tax=Tachypleus tridentatus TaxID=6853 RepID=UPI003FD3913A